MRKLIYRSVPADTPEAVAENCLDIFKEYYKNNSLVEMTIEEKVKLYGDYFKGRDDVYPYLSVNKNDSSIKYYIPACVNEWKQGVCNKTMGKPCKNCKYRENKPLTLETIKKHILKY